MPVIDADTHIDENEETWAYVEESFRALAPVTVTRPTAGKETAPATRYWMVEGQLRRRPTRDDKRTGTVEATRNLLDVPARLRHMDELGVDVQVIYPSFFLRAPSDRPDLEVALCRGYNRWLADRCSQSHGRLRWVAVLPTLNMDETVKEIRFARDHGAAGVLKKGIECSDRLAGDPYFYPIYDEASQAGLAVCVHQGSGDPKYSDVSRAFGGLWHQVMPVIDACNSLAANGIPDMFPKLRVGFIEAGSMWAPYVINDLQTRHERIREFSRPFHFKSDLFKASRFFVTYQTPEDLPLLLRYGLEDCLVLGSDYSHTDHSMELRAHQTMRDRATAGEVSPVVVRKMLEDNPRALYGL